MGSMQIRNIIIFLRISLNWSMLLVYFCKAKEILSLSQLSKWTSSAHCLCCHLLASTGRTGRSETWRSSFNACVTFLWMTLALKWRGTGRRICQFQGVDYANDQISQTHACSWTRREVLDENKKMVLHVISAAGPYGDPHRQSWL